MPQIQKGAFFELRQKFLPQRISRYLGCVLFASDPRPVGFRVELGPPHAGLAASGRAKALGQRGGRDQSLEAAKVSRGDFAQVRSSTMK